MAKLKTRAKTTVMALLLFTVLVIGALNLIFTQIYGTPQITLWPRWGAGKIMLATSGFLFLVLPFIVPLLLYCLILRHGNSKLQVVQSGTSPMSRSNKIAPESQPEDDVDNSAHEDNGPSIDPVFPVEDNFSLSEETLVQTEARKVVKMARLALVTTGVLIIFRIACPIAFIVFTFPDILEWLGTDKNSFGFLIVCLRAIDKNLFILIVPVLNLSPLSDFVKTFWKEHFGSGVFQSVGTPDIERDS